MNVYAVTGASGYLGGLIAHAFARDHGPKQVRCLVRNRDQAEPFLRNGFQVLVGDLTDSSVAEPLTDGCRVLFHAAAYMSAGSRDDIFDVNVHGTARLAQAAAAAGAHLLFVS